MHWHCRWPDRWLLPRHRTKPRTVHPSTTEWKICLLSYWMYAQLWSLPCRWSGLFFLILEQHDFRPIVAPMHFNRFFGGDFDDWDVHFCSCYGSDCFLDNSGREGKSSWWGLKPNAFGHNITAETRVVSAVTFINGNYLPLPIIRQCLYPSPFVVSNLIRHSSRTLQFVCTEPSNSQFSTWLLAKWMVRQLRTRRTGRAFFFISFA